MKPPCLLFCTIHQRASDQGKNKTNFLPEWRTRFYPIVVIKKPEILNALYSLNRRLSNTTGRRLIRTINISSIKRYLQCNLIYKNAMMKSPEICEMAMLHRQQRRLLALLSGAGFIPSGFSSY